MTPLLTATLITKNEKPNVRRCLDSLWPHVDEIVVADTGSTDGTVAEFRRYATQHGDPGKIKTVRVKACNDKDGQIKDFSVARQAADDVATGDWLVWCDLDDEIHGLDRLREMAAGASDDIVAFFCRYRYAADADGNPVSSLWRERVVRNVGVRWQGRLHEHKVFSHGGCVKVPAGDAEWVHHRDHAQRTGDRNLRILEAWLADEPDNPRVVQSTALELMGSERHDEAAAMFGRYLALPGEPPDRRAQATRHMSVMLMVLGRSHEARAASFQSLAEHWLWADTHLTLAEVEHTLGRPDVALRHAQTALEIGEPETLLIVNPLQYTAHARTLMAVCLAQLDRPEEAMSMLDRALEIAPHYPFAVDQQPRIRAQLRRHLTLGSFLPTVETLLAVGEVAKARALLDCAPWYVTDDPRIVAKRGELARMIADRAADVHVPFEDNAADEFVDRHLADQTAA